MVGALAAALVALAGYVALRTGVARRAERSYAVRRPPGDDGVVPGAEGFTLPGTNGRALLMLHGSGDTPQTLRYLAARLHDEGFTVRVPLLPGHGRGLRDFATVSAHAYLRTAEEELDRLRATSGWVGIVGLSMGGAIAVRLAARCEDVRALVLLAPYLTPTRSVAIVGRVWPFWSFVLPYLGGRGGTESIHDPVARDESYAYGVFPPRAVHALVETAAAARRALPAITAPTLVVNSREDNRIPRALAETASATLRAPTERHWLTGCGHVITVDYCRDAVAALVLDFIARHAD
ncbi:MAG: alpha/beta fold hydrolase [Gemmatimonadaceae bacterium]